MAAWDECASELDAALSWWSVERRTVGGITRFRISGRSRARGTVVQAQSHRGEALSAVVERLLRRLNTNSASKEEVS
jgi:hypothetical protein